MLGVLLVAVVGIFVLLYIIFNSTSNKTPISSDGSAAIIEGQPYTGITNFNPPQTLQDFTLTNVNNEPVKLSDFKGNYALVFFGYTNCPDVCPLTMLEYKKYKLRLGSQADQVKFVFVSVDPERDSLQVIGDYLAKFDESIIGLRGDVATLETIIPNFEAAFNIAPDDLPTPATGYMVQHSDSVYLVDPDMKLVAKYDNGADTGLVLGDLQPRLKS